MNSSRPATASSGVPTSAGRFQHLTVLFADIRGFTRVSEGMTANEAIALLNSYHTRMAAVAEQNQGHVDKIMGDGILVTFGAHRDDPAHEAHAVRAALQMLQEMEALADSDQPALRMAIGIQSGETLIAEIGPVGRMESSVIGETVNIAARLEAATREYGCDVLLGSETANAVRDLFPVTRQGNIGLPGRSLEVYSLQMTDSSAAPARDAAVN